MSEPSAKHRRPAEEGLRYLKQVSGVVKDLHSIQLLFTFCARGMDVSDVFALIRLTFVLIAKFHVRSHVITPYAAKVDKLSHWRP